MGKFIVFEGIDGVGKTSLSKELTQIMCKNNYPSLFLQTPAGNAYRQSLPYIQKKCDVNSHYLFYLSGILSTSQRINKLLRKYHVICDRYIYSTIVYHKARETSIDIDITSLNLLKPDLVFYLKVSSDDVRKHRLTLRGISHPSETDDLFRERLEHEYSKFTTDFIEIDNTFTSKEETLSKLFHVIESIIT